MQVTLALSPREVKIVKCNGNNLQRNKKKHDVYALQPDYLSQSIVVIGVCPSQNLVSPPENSANQMKFAYRHCPLIAKRSQAL